jgi:hypothetical protein
MAAKLRESAAVRGFRFRGRKVSWLAEERQSG